MPATVKGGFWEFNGVGTLSTISPTSMGRRRASQALAMDQNLALREVMRALTGAAPGASAFKQQSRVAATEDLSGVRPIELVTLVNTTTTTADANDIKADILSLSSKTYNPNPPPNLDGNPLGTR